jgi:hypothetical protein
VLRGRERGGVGGGEAEAEPGVGVHGGELLRWGLGARRRQWQQQQPDPSSPSSLHAFHRVGGRGAEAYVSSAAARLGRSCPVVVVC